MNEGQSAEEKLQQRSPLGTWNAKSITHGEYLLSFADV